MIESPPLPQLKPGQRARIRIWDRDTGAVRTLVESSEYPFEAPNWTADNRLLVNAHGRLWVLPLDGSTPPVAIEAPGLPPVNNDHVLAPSGDVIYASANDWHIWSVPIEGGEPTRLTEEDGALHFLHGVSPDGRRLAYVRLEPDGGNWWASAKIHTMSSTGGDDLVVTTHPGPADGCEWTPDGEWILFNTEQFSLIPGHAQLARVREDGTGLEQLTFDERVNWFPHPDPAGEMAVYLSYPPGTTGHPGGLPVELRLVRMDAWTEPTVVVELLGGQGTINVPSWAPDGSAFAFVDYPCETEEP